MMSSNVIDIEKAREARRLRDELHGVVDTHDAVLDVSNVVFTSEDISYNTRVTDDYIIITTEKDDGDNQS